MFPIFISYPGDRFDIAEDLRGRLQELGVNAWVYSQDALLAEDTWEEIRKHIHETRVFAFLISKETDESQGQRQELDLALTRVKQEIPAFSIFPIPIDDGVTFKSLPEPLQSKNGRRLHGGNVKIVAFQIATQFFPETVQKWTNEARWRCPRPGDWLEVCNMEGAEVEEYFELEDRVYFRRLDPGGLFECYAPKINGLFWFWEEHLRPVPRTDPIWSMERNLVPERFRIFTLIAMEILGYEEWDRRHRQ